jgi:hypothetical protein
MCVLERKKKRCDAKSVSDRDDAVLLVVMMLLLHQALIQVECPR